jgi:hypothetical protein
MIFKEQDIEFLTKVAQISKKMGGEHFVSNSTGLTIVRVNDSNYVPIGCPLCLMGKRGQGSLGQPTINNINLIAGENAEEISSEIPQEIMVNIWLCPQCRMPQKEFVPNFKGPGFN